MCFINSIIFLLVSVFVASEGQTCQCDVLAPIYKSLECSSWCRIGSCIVKYDCTKSLYMLSNDQEQCYYKGNFYNVSERLPGRYPNSAKTHLCRYECRVSSAGWFFSVTNNCIPRKTEQPTDACPLEIINNIDYMYTHSAPIFSKNNTSVCPTYWVQYEPVEYSGDFCPIKKRCCNYGTLTIGKGKNFTIKSVNGTCTCSCPPFVTCYV